MPTDTPITGLRLKSEVRERLERMSKASDRSMTSITSAAINVFWEQYQDLRRDREALATEGMELLRQLEERLGEHFYDGCGALAFERLPSGDVAVNLKKGGYYGRIGGRFMTVRGREGRAEYAEIADDGAIGPWVAAPDPVLN